MKKDITDLFVFIDDFCTATDLFINSHLLATNQKLIKPTRVSKMTNQEIIPFSKYKFTDKIFCKQFVLVVVASSVV